MELSFLILVVLVVTGILIFLVVFVRSFLSNKGMPLHRASADSDPTVWPSSDYNSSDTNTSDAFGGGGDFDGGGAGGGFSDSADVGGGSTDAGAGE